MRKLQEPWQQNAALKQIRVMLAQSGAEKRNMSAEEGTSLKLLCPTSKASIEK